MDQALELRVYFWRLRRRYVRMPVVAVLVLGLTALVIQHNWLRFTEGVDVVESSCMPYQITVPASWNFQLLTANRCGFPMLNEDYQASVNNQQVNVSVDAVRLNLSDGIQSLQLMQGDSGIRLGKMGQAYVILQETSDNSFATHATFVAGGLSFVVSVRGTNDLTLNQTLLRVMDGWKTTGDVLPFRRPVPGPITSPSFQ